MDINVMLAVILAMVFITLCVVFFLFFEMCEVKGTLSEVQSEQLSQSVQKQMRLACLQERIRHEQEHHTKKDEDTKKVVFDVTDKLAESLSNKPNED